MPKSLRYLSALLPAGLFILLIFIGGCGADPSNSINAGHTISWQSGLPNFDLELIASPREEKTGIDVLMGIPYQSLVFLKNGEAFKAGYNVILRITKTDGTGTVDESGWSEEIFSQSYDSTQSTIPIIRERWMAMDPGEYIVEAILQDLFGEKKTSRQITVTVFELAKDNPAMTRIRVEARQQGRGFEPLVAWHLPGELDSMRAVIGLYNPGDEVQIEMTLRKFRSDTTIGYSPCRQTAAFAWQIDRRSRSHTLRARGIRYSSSDVVQRVSRRLVRPADEVTLEFAFPALDPGNYRLEILATIPGVSENEEDTLLTQERDLSIKGPDFPRLATMREMIEPLAYIADPAEYDSLISIEIDEAERRRRFDSFWGSSFSNRQVAINSLKRFYGRVEEANLLFSAHKEGWKTDRGMVYILLGAPEFVYKKFSGRADEELWLYPKKEDAPTFSTGQTGATRPDSANYYVFKNFNRYSERADLGNFILQNTTEKEELCSAAVRWRYGEVY